MQISKIGLRYITNWSNMCLKTKFCEAMPFGDWGNGDLYTQNNTNMSLEASADRPRRNSVTGEFSTKGHIFPPNAQNIYFHSLSWKK